MKALILVNPRAGDNLGVLWLKALRKRLAGGRRGVAAVVEPTRDGEILEQVRQWSEQVDRIIVVGGDGTVSWVTDALCKLHLDLPIGIIPMGTGNDLARSLGLYRDRLWRYEEGLRYLTASKTVSLDLWSVNGRLTFNNYLSVGLDARIVQDFSRVRRWLKAHPILNGRGAYFPLYLFIWTRYLEYRIESGSRLSWTDPTGELHRLDLREPRVLVVSNTPYYAAGSLIDPTALPNDGLLEVTLFSHMRHYAELMVNRVPFVAKVGFQDNWWRSRARSLEIEFPSPPSVQADGEDITEHLGDERIMRIGHERRISVLIKK